MVEFKQRVSDCAIQEWLSKLNGSSKLSPYCMYKFLLEPEKYLNIICNYKYRNALCKLRCSTHSLHVEIGRHNNIPREDRLCKWCEKNNLTLIEN